MMADYIAKKEIAEELLSKNIYDKKLLNILIEFIDIFLLSDVNKYIITIEEVIKDCFVDEQEQNDLLYILKNITEILYDIKNTIDNID